MGPDDIVSPGHVFPLTARDGGVLVRAGHTEAAVDISRLAGLNPSGVICEIMKDDGTMARMDDLVAFARMHNLKMGTIGDFLAYRRKHDHLFEMRAEMNSEFADVRSGVQSLRADVASDLLTTEKRLAEQDMAIELTPAAKKLLSERGYDPALGARPLRRVIQRVSDVTQTPEANAEYAQLVYYHSCPSADDPSCAFYKRHNDYIDSDEHKLQGPRIYTLFGYMNDVPEGGGTRFTSLPAAKYRDANGMVTIQPQRGKAILWPSVTEAEPFKKEERTDHEALPVTRGEKFGANFWIHQYDFKGAHATGCTHDK
jgi:hypothetical protein